MGVVRSLRRWLFKRRLQKLLDLPLERFTGGDAAGAGWAFHFLARTLEDGSTVPKDTALAFRCRLRSAQAGLPLGQICAGLAYLTGTGTTMDLVAAQAWLQAAAVQGDPGAVILVGIQGGEIF
jgi:TPR repeat protein